MKILGYSERGIINSLIFCIVESKDKELMNKFIELIKIPELTVLGEPNDYTILLEQSFSGFGDADLVIIMEYDMRKTPIETSEQNHTDISAVQLELMEAQKEILELQSQIQWLERSYE